MTQARRVSRQEAEHSGEPRDGRRQGEEEVRLKSDHAVEIMTTTE